MYASLCFSLMAISPACSHTVCICVWGSYCVKDWSASLHSLLRYCVNKNAQRTGHTGRQTGTKHKQECLGPPPTVGLRKNVSIYIITFYHIYTGTYKSYMFLQYITKISVLLLLSLDAEHQLSHYYYNTHPVAEQSFNCDVFLAILPKFRPVLANWCVIVQISSTTNEECMILDF